MRRRRPWVAEVTAAGVTLPVWHVNALPWWAAAPPLRLHICRPQTRTRYPNRRPTDCPCGQIKGARSELVERCRCGAIREAGAGMFAWRERNTRRVGK